MARSYNRHKEVVNRSHLQPVSTDAPRITPQTTLVSVDDAVQQIKESKGWAITARTIREKCRAGKWERGVHWVKPGRSYLINLEAVYWTLVQY
ncbi:MAG TPA: hypothetical protein V6C65_00375 [Allocoleopsis sp.]